MSHENNLAKNNIPCEYEPNIILIVYYFFSLNTLLKPNYNGLTNFPPKVQIYSEH